MFSGNNFQYFNCGSALSCVTHGSPKERNIPWEISWSQSAEHGGRG